ncbi:DUF3102 domain-containing protein [Salmonella enterica]|uniref:DUF3102 domain-containing protein n=1 Tax=Salmonella enterica subsp. enterica serovar Panama TaxID=29472 RepID=A0A5U8JCT3_SALET|nr:DUF3102 domain-containing protein [Salmonella enterica]EBR7993297.1 DUF3102 domain-containing protein [Salmonella enterica subsp. enterica serovar Panama]ECC9937749.1 DUF3102 domain-containing protein [Salmonella enterica subsp. enterica]EEN2094741.1 DUF3102 domain-containing protein [Salmonella enterica subsp. enterica serovar Florida]ASD84968.1 DUF3102 domain-containing protein [Salmonella enterica subsp. enterica serovar India str. SA20085604]EBR8434078.1 DUF3102 domain-containing protei
MARKPTALQVIDPIDGVVPDSLNVELNEITQHRMAIMEQFGEGLPYERTRIIHEAKFYMAQSAEAMLEAGKRLVILKENEPHGDFIEIVESQLSLPKRTAQIMMQASLKYLSPKLESKAQALALLGKTKLFELMTESDEELADLADGGTIADMTLDDIDRMTTRELRKALRESKEDLAASRKLNAEKSQEINELKETQFRTVDPDGVIQKWIHDFGEEHEKFLRTFISTVPFFFQKLEDDYNNRGINHMGLMAGLLHDIEREIASVRAQFDIPELNIPDTSWNDGPSEEDENFQMPELKTTTRSLEVSDDN